MSESGQRRVVFILGTPFSGSTTLGLKLNGLPSVRFLGEVDRLRHFHLYEGPMDDPNMPVVGCELCRMASRRCTLFEREEVLAAGPEAVHAALFKTERERVFLDGSKNARWFRMCAGPLLAGGVDVRAIVVSRNPFAYAESVLRRNPALGAWWAAQDWRDRMVDILRTISFHPGVPGLNLQFDDFQARPDDWMPMLARFLGVDPAPFTSRYWEVPDVHPLGGNLSAYLRFAGFNEGRLYADWGAMLERHRSGQSSGRDWATKLTDVQYAEVLMTPGLADVAALLAYDLAALLRSTVADPVGGTSASEPLTAGASGPTHP